MAPLHRLSRRAMRRKGSLALALFLAMLSLVGALALSPAPRALASSQGSVYIYPSAGGPGTRVQLELHFFGDTRLFLIKLALSPPENGGCDHAQALPGEGGKPVQLGGIDVTHVEFDWPASLASNSYYFCVFPAAYPTAAPTSTDVIASPSGTPSPTATATPTATPAPVITGPNEAFSHNPFIYTRDAAATVTLPNANLTSVVAGSRVAVTLTHWLSQNRAAPTSVFFVHPGQKDAPAEDTGVAADFAVTSPPDSKGNCTLTVTVPDDLITAPNALGPAQPYVLIVGGPGIYQRSDPLTIAPAISPTVAISPTPAPIVEKSNGVGVWQALGWIVAALAFLGAIGGVLYLALGRRQTLPDTPGDTGASNPWGGAPPQTGSGATPPWTQGGAPDWDAPTEPGRWPEDLR